MVRTFPYAVLLAAALLACGGEKAALKIGDRAPDFSAVDHRGERITLSGFAGSPVVLRFFLPDCRYCRADTAVFTSLYERFREQGLRMVYIDTGGMSPEETGRFIEDLGIPFPVAADPGGAIAADYGVRSLPQTIVVDPGGRIAGGILGGVSEAELLRFLAPYLEERKEGAGQ